MKAIDHLGNILTKDDIMPTLDTDGLVFLSEAGRDEFVCLLGPLLRIHRHPHSGADGWTLLQPSEGPDPAPGRSGFTTSGLAPHTDRSFLRWPPPLLCFLLLHAPDTGGEALLADAAHVSRTCDREEFAAVQHRLWLADHTGAFRQPVLSVQRGLHIYRYRDDLAGRPRADSPGAEALLAGLRRLTASPLRIDLRAGDGYLIHNHRILHGRTAFTGPRSAARLLASVAPCSPFSRLNEGFKPDAVGLPKVMT